MLSPMDNKADITAQSSRSMTHDKQYNHIYLESNTVG